MRSSMSVPTHVTEPQPHAHINKLLQGKEGRIVYTSGRRVGGVIGMCLRRAKRDDTLLRENQLEYLNCESPILFETQLHWIS